MDYISLYSPSHDWDFYKMKLLAWTPVRCGQMFLETAEMLFITSYPPCCLWSLSTCTGNPPGLRPHWPLHLATAQDLVSGYSSVTLPKGVKWLNWKVWIKRSFLENYTWLGKKGVVSLVRSWSKCQNSNRSKMRRLQHIPNEWWEYKLARRNALCCVYSYLKELHTFIGHTRDVTEAAAMTEGLNGGVLITERLHMSMLPSWRR